MEVRHNTFATFTTTATTATTTKDKSTICAMPIHLVVVAVVVVVAGSIDTRFCNFTRV